MKMELKWHTSISKMTVADYCTDGTGKPNELELTRDMKTSMDIYNWWITPYTSFLNHVIVEYIFNYMLLKFTMKIIGI